VPARVVLPRPGENVQAPDGEGVAEEDAAVLDVAITIVELGIILDGANESVNELVWLQNPRSG
jgi:hypothetical protein